MKPTPLVVLFMVMLSLITQSCSHSGKMPTSAAMPEKKQQPVLVIETGGHMDTIKDVIFSKDSSQLISASMDKTIRAWDMETGMLTRVIRGKIGKGLEGSVYDLSLSPDNEWLAVAGMLTECT